MILAVYNGTNGNRVKSGAPRSIGPARPTLSVDAHTIAVMVTGHYYPVARLTVSNINGAIGFRRPVGVNAILVLPANVDPRNVTVSVTFTTTVGAGVEVEMAGRRTTGYTNFFAKRATVSARHRPNRYLLGTDTHVDNRIITNIGYQAPRHHVMVGTFCTAGALARNIRFYVGCRQLYYHRVRRVDN